MKYGMWLDEWFRNYIQPSSKIKTCERYSEIIEKHLKVKLGEYELDELTPLVLQRYVTGLMQSGNIVTGKGLAANSVNGIITVIQNSLKLAYTLGELKEYTADKIKRPKTKEKEVLSNLAYAVTGQDGALDVYAFEKQLKTLNDIMDETMELAANSSGDGKRFQQEIRSLSEQMVVIREQLEIAKERIASNEKINSEIENIKEYLSSSDICFTEYSDVTVRRLVEYIRVMKDNSIIIVLKGGIQIREPIETNN